MVIENGTKLGTYEILSPLGAGGMGEVYLARDTTLGRDVAIKVLPADVASSPERLQRFEREAKTVATLNHPNIVTIHGIHNDNNQRFIAMELVVGETLDRMISPGGMLLAKIFDIAIPLSDALATAHDKGIVHRDLKPANVMVTKEGRVKVLDFGLAKLTAVVQGGSSLDDVTMSAPLTGRGVVIGTVPYMSPEQLQGESLDHRTDLFSLGVMLYEMVTGQRPFKGKNSATLTSSILRDAPRPVHELNSAVPRHLGRIIEHCLEKNAEDRYQSAKDVRNELRALRKEVDSGSDYSESQSLSVPTSVSLPPSSGSGTSLSGSTMSAPTRRGEFWIGVGVLVVVIVFVGLWIGRTGSVSEQMSVTNGRSRTTPVASVDSSAKERSLVQFGGKATLAILPFENISNDTDTDYLSNEIPANIIDKLSGLSGLSVISRSGAFRFDSAKEDASSFGKRLGASVVLTGQLNARGENLTIRAELVNVATNQQLWGKRYARELNDIMAVEADITQSISEALRLQLTHQERTKLAKSDTKNAEAHRAYLEARFWWNRRSEDAIERAIRLLDYAISLDPTYARAYAGKADCYLVAQAYRPAKEVVSLAKKAIVTALRLDDSMGEAYASLGLLTGQIEHDWAKAEIAFKRGISLSPRYATLHQWYAQMLMAQGKFVEALSELERASEIEPNSLIIRTNTAWALCYAGHVREAFVHIEATRKIDPNFLPGQETYAGVLMANGQPERAIPVLKQLYASGGRTLFSAGALGMAYAMTGHVAKAEGELSTLKQLARRQFIPAIAFAKIYANLGDTDEAFRWLDKAYQNSEYLISFVNIDSAFNALRGDPRFDALIRRIGLEPREAPTAPSSAKKAKRSLAVIPFENRNADEDAAYLADEIPASIINRLSQMSGLRVVPRSTVFRLSDQNLDRKELVRRLNVQTLLTGQVSQRGGQLIIRAELIDVESDSQIWGERFIKTAEEWLTVEEEIAQKISDSLKLKLTGAERAQLTKRYTENSDAYRAYLQGRFWWNKRSAEGFNKAIEYFQQAIDRDSNYALALAGLADTHILLGIYQLVPPNDAVREARIAAQAALRADDMLAEAHVSLGGVQAFYDWDWTSAQTSFQRAHELNPTYATAYHWGAYVYVAQGDLDRATDTIEHANQLDPLSLIIMTDLGRLYRLAGRYKESEQVFLKAREIDSEFAPIVRELAVLYMETDRAEKGIEILEAAYTPTNKGNVIASTLGQAYAFARETAKARDLIRTLERRASERYVSPMVFASIYASLGEKDRAIEFLEKAYRLRDPLALRLTLYPALEQLQTDPHVAKLMRRGGFTPVRKPPVLKRREPRKLMLAVLPFDNLSGSPDQEYFSDGMTEEMITTLGRISPVKLGVIARTSAMRYKDTTKGVDEIGRELAVGYVVEGSIRRAAGRVRISAKLIQVSDQTQLWSNSYERDLADVFKIQVEVAEAIAESLAVELLPDRQAAQAKPPTESSAAYDEYLLGRSYWARRTPESLHTAIKHFKHAIKLDPNYALAYSGLADTWNVMPWYVPGPYKEMYAEANKAAELAFALDDSLAETHASMAELLQRQGYWVTAFEHYRKALEIDPNNATAHQWYGQALGFQGRFDEGALELERSITLDPLSAVMRLCFGTCMRLARRWDVAVEQLSKALELQPNLGGVGTELTLAYLGKHDHAAAAASFVNFLTTLGHPPNRIERFRKANETMGIKDALIEWLNSFHGEDSLPYGAATHAELLAWCGEKDRAFEWLERAVRQQDPYLLLLETSHAYDNLRNDPRYADLLKRIGAKRRTEEVQPMP